MPACWGGRPLGRKAGIWRDATAGKTGEKPTRRGGEPVSARRRTVSARRGRWQLPEAGGDAPGGQGNGPRAALAAVKLVERLKGGGNGEVKAMDQDRGRLGDVKATARGRQQAAERQGNGHRTAAGGKSGQQPKNVIGCGMV